MRYRSNTNSFIGSDRILTQRVSHPAESIIGGGANCMDGTLLFASAFENMGLRSYIVLVPGHAFVGVRLDEKTRMMMFVETTAVGKASFDQAVVLAGSIYREQDARRAILMIDVQSLRRLGITPFPYSLGLSLLPRQRSEDAGRDRWYLRVGDRILGPYTVAQLKSLVDLGVAVRNSPVRAGKKTPWTLLQSAAPEVFKGK